MEYVLLSQVRNIFKCSDISFVQQFAWETVNPQIWEVAQCMDRENGFEMQAFLNLILFNTEARAGEQASGVKQNPSADMIRAMQIRSRVWLCDPMNHNMPGLPVHHQLPEFIQTHAHRVGDAIQPSHPLLSPSPLAPNPSQDQGLFQWVNSLHEVAKVFQLQHHRLGLLWYWMVCLGNEQKSFCCFWDCIQVLNFRLFCWL